MAHTDTTQDTSSLQQFGRFKVERLLGQGGFASVYLAIDPRLNRRVALKVPKPAMLESPDAKVRFEREARAAAMLSHPSIVPVFECGEQNGQSYIASAYCPGQTLGSWIRRQPGEIELETAVSIIAELAEGVGHAHQRGIIHRDLKPANVLVDSDAQSIAVPTPFMDPDCETQTIAPSTKRDAAPLVQNDAETIQPGQNDTVPGIRVDEPHVPQDTSAGDDNILGRLRITDFGLAKSTTENQELTVEGTIMGTPSYMSPEQAGGRSDVGAASDIFTLGTMLFELVTGSVPFKRDTTINTMMAIADDPLPAIGIFRKSVPKDIEAICQKCMEKDPSRRYASAFDLAADLNAWLEGRPIVARAATSFEKFTKLCRRNSGLTSAIALALLSLTLGLAGTTWSWRSSEANLAKANFEFQRAEKNLAKATKAAEEERKARNSAEQVALYMIGVFKSPNPAVAGRDVKVIDILEDATARLDESFGEDPDVRLELMLAIGDCYRQLGEYEDSIDILTQAKAFRETNFPDDDYMQIQVRDRLGQGWIENRELDLAIEAFEQNLELAAELEGTESKLYVTTERNLAACYMYNEDYEAAIPIIELSLARENGEIKPESILGMRNMLASCYGNTGRNEEAIEAFEEVLAQQKALLGEDHPSCLETANNLAVQYSNNGQQEKAAEQQEFILEQSINIHGDEHPITLRCMNNLASTYLGLGNYEESTPLYRETYRLCQVKLGQRHFNTLSVGQALANSLIEEGDYDDAIPILETARKPLVKAMGNSHSRIMLLHSALGRAYEHTERYSDAVDAFKEVLSGFEDETVGSAHEHSIRATIVRLQIKNGEAEQAEQFATQLLESVNRNEEASDFSKLIANLTMGVVKVHGANMDDASEFLEFSLSRRDWFPKFSDDEKEVARQVAESLIENLQDIDSDGSLFDPEEWQAVLDSM